MTILKGYQPAHVVRYFEEICAIPHPSHHEQALCAYIRGCAERYGHRYVEDAAGNLMVYLNATPGYEDKAPMLLQAHMDMVSAKEPGSNHNFLTDPSACTSKMGTTCMPMTLHWAPTMQLDW